MSDVLILNKDAQPLSMVPFSAIPWQTAIRLVYQGKVRVIDEYQDWSVCSPSTTLAVPSVVMTSEFIKWNRMIKYNRSNILLRDGFACQYCGNSKEAANRLTLDHVVPRTHGGKTNWTNIVTACQRCNHAKGANKKVVPKRMPVRPSYYELMAKRMNYPLVVRDESWLPYLSWPAELIQLVKTKRRNND